MILPAIKSPQNAILLAEKLLASMRKLFKVGKRTLKITCSIGIACFQGGSMSEIELLKQADQALYAAKKASKNSFSMVNCLSTNSIQHDG